MLVFPVALLIKFVTPAIPAIANKAAAIIRPGTPNDAAAVFAIAVNAPTNPLALFLSISSLTALINGGKILIANPNAVMIPNQILEPVIALKIPPLVMPILLTMSAVLLTLSFCKRLI